MTEVSLVKLLSDECQWTLLMMSQHWFRQWLGGIRQQPLQSSRMDFTLRLPIGRRKHQMIIILTNPTSDIWILCLTWQTCWRDFVKTAITWANVDPNICRLMVPQWVISMAWRKAAVTLQSVLAMKLPDSCTKPLKKLTFCDIYFIKIVFLHNICSCTAYALGKKIVLTVSVDCRHRWKCQTKKPRIFSEYHSVKS